MKLMPCMSNRELESIQEIIVNLFSTQTLIVKDLSWLEALALISNGNLLAKILYKLEESDLKLVSTVSTKVWKVCKQYQLHERFYTGKAYTFGNDIKNQHSVLIPSIIEGIIEPIAFVSCGTHHKGIVTVSGKAYTFGYGKFGRLGNGRIDDHNVGIPVQIQGITEPIASISCAEYHTGIVTVSGNVYTFGNGNFGTLGDGIIDYHCVGIPVQVQGIIEPIASISCGSYYTGIVTVSGKAYTFGSGYDGKLGNGKTDHHYVGIPVQIEGIREPVASISCGTYHTGIVTVSGKAYTFGSGYGGKLGNGRTDDHSVGIPVQVQGITEPVASISCAHSHTGIVTVSGKAYTFGDGIFGKLGNGKTDHHSVGIPTQIERITESVASISCGNFHTGIVTVSGKVYTFGYGYGRRLESGEINSNGIPAQIGDLIIPVKSISCGDYEVGLVTMPESSLNLDIN